MSAGEGGQPQRGAGGCAQQCRTRGILLVVLGDQDTLSSSRKPGRVYTVVGYQAALYCTSEEPLEISVLRKAEK